MKISKLARNTIKKVGRVVGMEHFQNGDTYYFALKNHQKNDFNVDIIPTKFLTDDKILNNLYIPK